MENTKIEWATHTFNPFEGCAKVSPGCKNCYADAQHSLHHSSLKQQQGTCWGINAPRMGKSADNWKKPLKWNREAQASGTRARVFCASMADVFENQSELSKSFAGQTAQVPTGNGKTRTVTFVDIATERLRLLRLIYDTPHLDWLLLTKRPENIVPALGEAHSAIDPGADCTGPDAEFSSWVYRWFVGYPPANVWLGTSVENQEQADARIPHLLAAPAAVRFLSCEPLLGPVDLSKWMPPGRVRARCSRCGYYTEKEPGCKGYCNGKPCDGLVCPGCNQKHGWSGSHRGNGRPNGQPLSWVIVGGESGPRARPMHPEWAQNLRDQCQEAGVAFFFKQWGSYGTIFRNMATEQPIMRQFDDFQHWVNKAGPWMQGATCVDTGGNVLEIGGDFMAARDANRFPVALLHRMNKHEAGRLLDGRTYDELPSPRA